MSYRGSGSGGELSDVFQDFLSGCARFLMFLGGLASLAAIAFLVFTCFHLNGQNAHQETADALRNVEIFRKVLVAGLLGLAVGASYTFWGEDLLGAAQLIFSALLYFAPLYVPEITGGTSSNGAIQAALSALQQGGMAYGVVAIGVLVVDLGLRVRNRVKVGVKSDQMRYGKGMKEEPDKQNVILGKCWQLPYCRKFVREKCPIFHAKRTCWKEQVGCMCEEEVIRNAMSSKVIPKDQVLAAAMIPRNSRLTSAQKSERCKNCVIYNEHQRHKYTVLLPVTFAVFVGGYVALRGALLEGTQHMVIEINKVVQGVSYNSLGQANVPPAFVELMLVIFTIIALAYTLKILEFVVFKLKL